MLALILVLLLAAILFGSGFAVSFLWLLAAIVLAVWIVGFLAHSSGRRWYYW